MPSTQDQSVKKRQEPFVKGGKGQAKDAVTYLTNSSETNWPLPSLANGCRTRKGEQLLAVEGRMYTGYY